MRSPIFWNRDQVLGPHFHKRDFIGIQQIPAVLTTADGITATFGLGDHARQVGNLLVARTHAHALQRLGGTDAA